MRFDQVGNIFHYRRILANAGFPTNCVFASLHPSPDAPMRRQLGPKVSKNSGADSHARSEWNYHSLKLQKLNIYSGDTTSGSLCAGKPKQIKASANCIFTFKPSLQILKTSRLLHPRLTSWITKIPKLQQYKLAKETIIQRGWWWWWICNMKLMLKMAMAQGHKRLKIQNWKKISKTVEDDSDSDVGWLWLGL